MLSGVHIRPQQHPVDSVGTSCREVQHACHPKHIRLPYRKQQTACKAARSSQEEEVQLFPAGLRRGAIAAAAAVWLSAMPLPAGADVPMVSPSEVIEAAKPLAKQPVQKGKVWGLLLGGSAALFGLTVALERSKVFPAIAKANEAMSISKAAREGATVAEQQQEALDVQPESNSWEEEPASTDAVLQGLQSASRRVLDDEGTAAAVKSAGTADTKADAPAAAAKAEYVVAQTANDSTTSSGTQPQDSAPTTQPSSESATGSAFSSSSSMPSPPAASPESPTSTSASDSSKQASEQSEQSEMQAEDAEERLGSHSSAKQQTQQPVSDADSRAQSDAVETAEGTAKETAKATAEGTAKETATSSEAPAAFEDAKPCDASDLQPNVAAAATAAPAAQRSQAPNETPSAVLLSEMSPDDLQRLITAKKQQQQQQQEAQAAKARSREEPSKGAGKDLADLSEEELQTLIASKRKMAANVVKTVVDP